MILPVDSSEIVLLGLQGNPAGFCERGAATSGTVAARSGFEHHFGKTLPCVPRHDFIAACVDLFETEGSDRTGQAKPHREWWSCRSLSAR